MRPSSPSLRLLGYLRPYRGRLLGTALLMVAFALLSGVSIGMISPFIKVRFTPRPAAVVGPPAPQAAPAVGAPPLTGVAFGGAVAAPGTSAVGAARGASAEDSSGILGRFLTWKRELRTWFESFFLTGNPLRSLTRICFALLIIFLLKNLCDYLQSVQTVWVEQAVVRDL